jgi:hypothetical protein
MMPALSRVTELGAEKRCLACGEYWPADTEFFQSRLVTRDRLSACCIACSRERIKKKPADESGLKTIFLEENSGDRCIMLRRHIYV